MKMMNLKSTFLQFSCVLLASFCQGQQSSVRLTGGPTGVLGRLEVHDGFQWGTVCDDGWIPQYCELACRDMGYQSGRLLTAEERGYLGRCEDLPILWDDVRCSPSVTSLLQCEHTPGPSNCNHEEDVHCACTPRDTTRGQQTSAPPESGPLCDLSRHHITPYDPNFPWIGRAEVTSSDGSTRHAICDDFWDDEDAQVFCSCFDKAKSSSQGYRTFFRTSYTNMPPLSMKYTGVHCTKEQAQGIPRNIFHCDVTEATPGNSPTCDVMKEAAGVACGPIPKHFPPAAPVVTVSCDTQTMKVCFEAGDSSYTLNPAYLKETLRCNDVKTSQVPAANGLSKACMEIDMNTCMTSDVYVATRDHKTYCYNVTYSEYDRFPGVMLTDTVWDRRACCQILLDNKTVSANFIAHTTEAPMILAQRDLRFHMEVYTDETFSGAPLSFPANVTRGQDLFTKVTVNTWDPSLYLVVPSCRFSPTDRGLPHYAFWADNCPRSNALNVNYYNLGPHTWGLQFTVPLFQNYQSLYMVCETYVCDRQHDTKPYCDRSCSNFLALPDGSPRRKRSLAHFRADMAEVGIHDKVQSGYLHVQNNGFGPLITPSGKVLDIEANTTYVKVGDEVKRVQYHGLELLPSNNDVTNARPHDSVTSSKQEVPSLPSAGHQVALKPWMLIMSLLLLFSFTFNLYGLNFFWNNGVNFV